MFSLMRMFMRVRVAVMMVMMIVAMGAHSQTPVKQPHADGGDKYGAGGFELKRDPVEIDVERRVENCKPEQEDGKRVGDRDGGSKQEGVADRTACTGQVGGHQRFAVAGRERVRRTKKKRHAQSGQPRAWTAAGAAKQCVESAFTHRP